MIEAVREEGFEGIVAKRRDRAYKPGQRSAVWQKMRVLQRRDFAIGGYTPTGRNFDAILIGDYKGRAFQYVAKVHGDGDAGGGFQAIPWARNENVPVQELARGASRSVGRRTNGRGDGKMPLAETTVDCDD